MSKLSQGVPMKIEAPILESKLPPAKKSGHYKHLAIYEAVMKLPTGKVLPVVFETEDQAKKFGFTIQHSNFAKFKSFVREKTVYLRLWNEDDEKQRKHILELRELGRKRKIGTLPAVANVASKS
jgi:hypothetical protein